MNECLKIIAQIEKSKDFSKISEIRGLIFLMRLPIVFIINESKLSAFISGSFAPYI